MGKWILLTGASSGIGRAAASYLDECGYNLVLVARRAEALQNLQGELKNDSLAVPFDLAETSRIGEIFENVKANGVKLDGLLHSAGIGQIWPVRNNEIEAMESQMRVNHFAFVEMGKYFSLKKYSNDGSSVVAISSLASLNCYNGACNYAASKAALNAAVRVMSKEFFKRKIRVNAILPGYVATPRGPGEDDPEYLAQQPLGIIQPEHIAYLAEFLLSDKAGYITGSLFPVSGGMAY